MRKRIDAHVHLAPEWLLGQTEEPIRYEVGGVWNIGNGTAFLQRLPEYCFHHSFNVTSLLQVMKNNGIEKSVILQGLFDTVIGETYNAIREYPDKFWGAAKLNPAKGDVAEQLELFHRMGFHIIKCFVPSFGSLESPFEKHPFDGEEFRKAWALAEKYHMSIAIDPGSPGNPLYTVDAFENVIRDYPGLRVIICHMGMPKPVMDRNSEEYRQWEHMKSLGRYDNVWFDCSSLTTVFLEEDYPFVSAQKMVRAFMDEFSSKKVIWASDIPGTFCDATYRQMINAYERSGLFSEEEKDNLFYNNAVDAYAPR